MIKAITSFVGKLRFSTPQQSCESNVLDKQNASNEEVSDRAVLVDEPAGEQQTKDDRQEIEPDNNTDRRVNCRLGSECDKEQHQNQKNIRAVGSGYGELQLARDTNDIQSNIKSGWTLIFRHIAGKLNKEADALSKLPMAWEYSIRKEVLENVSKDWQVELTVDLFAARNNAKHKRYYTLGKDKKAERRDSMKISRDEKFPQIHPLILIIRRIIRKILEEKAQGIMIVPYWPGQIWWTQLKKITVKEKQLEENNKALKMGPKMKKRNLKVPSGRIFALEVNGDKMGQDYSQMLWKLPYYQEMQLYLQQITDMKVGEGTPARYQPFGSIQEGHEQARISVSTMFDLMGREEKDIRNKVIEQLMLNPVSNIRKIIRKVTIWKLEQLLGYIVKLSVQRDQGKLTVIELWRVVITIFKDYKVLRLSEIQTAMLNITQIEQGIIIICTNLLKGQGRRVEVTLKRVSYRAVSPIAWFQAWNEKRKTKTTNKDLQWKNSENKRALTLEECSKEIHIVMNNAGIHKKFSVTVIRKVALFAMQNKDKTKIEIDRWSRHSGSADTVRENYDVNNNDSIRKTLSECVSAREESGVSELRE
ncbi:MAG: hypothetical protein EZS28_024842 [Streblomastix strix]|uniref:Tyr recombinase domain-containing protein n=1 Tax=Streblomastix strix TaxID=222440 RepID=A0A5J4VAV4_9EUKA|nr:MAG: hypothetical protein EZS28_024842 [Streblomastix strix]